MMKAKNSSLNAMQLVFYTRLALYLATCALPFVHPSIAVPYDTIGLWLWFGLVPAEMLVAYYLAPPRLRLGAWLAIAAGLIGFSVFAVANFSSGSLLLLVGGTLSFLSTVLVFKTKQRGHVVAVLEVFFLGFLYYKFLGFSRASEVTAQQSAGFTQLVLVLGACVFLIHCILLYRAAYQSGPDSRFRKEAALMLAVGIPLVLAIALLLPPDFVDHAIVFNFLKEEPTPEIVPLDETGRGLESGGSLRSQEQLDADSATAGESGGSASVEGGSSDGRSAGEGQGNRLRGIPAERWQDQRMGEEGEEGKQYAVMVVASTVDPVYAADGYYGHFDAQQGFQLSQDAYLNDLGTVRLLETWRTREQTSDTERLPTDVYFLSTIPDRVLAYQPYAVEPTVLKREHHPFSYSYGSVSGMSQSGPRDWARSPALDDATQADMQEYLEIPLETAVRARLTAYLDRVLQGKNGYFDKIEAILESYSAYQYQLGFEEDVSVARLQEFLFETNTGDCTEFSNTAALLARLAGIPARVVTGYLAAEDLQTPAHEQGLAMLQDALPPLQDMPFEELYLVTTAHRHSWAQFFLPDYGWIDFDPTSYAIPPQDGGDPGSMDVVIPLIQQLQEQRQFKFPWRLTLRLAALLAASLLAGLYLYRYGEELYLAFMARKESDRGLRALYRALLMKCAANGYPLKTPSQTAAEYAESCPVLGKFAVVYTILRYRANINATEKRESWRELRNDYRWAVTSMRRPGFLNALKRGFSLRGLYY